jgi:hypothetical protein
MNERKTTPQCGNCLFWVIVPAGGECHRSAPLPVQGLVVKPGINAWPLTAASDWCGEYQSNTPPPVNVSMPTISGSLPHGNVLTSTQGTWQNSPTSYAYQWQRNGVSIAGANASTYTTTTADQTYMITCAVTATNAGGSSTSTSNMLGPIT